MAVFKPSVNIMLNKPTIAIKRAIIPRSEGEKMWEKGLFSIMHYQF